MSDDRADEAERHRRLLLDQLDTTNRHLAAAGAVVLVEGADAEALTFDELRAVLDEQRWRLKNLAELRP